MKECRWLAGRKMGVFSLEHIKPVISLTSSHKANIIFGIASRVFQYASGKYSAYTFFFHYTQFLKQLCNQKSNKSNLIGLQFFLVLLTTGSTVRQRNSLQVNYL